MLFTFYNIMAIIKTIYIWDKISHICASCGYYHIIQEDHIYIKLYYINICFSYLYKNPEGQGSIVSSLLPTQDQQTDISAGQLLCGGLFSPDPVSNWLCAAALSHVFHDSDQMRQVELSSCRNNVRTAFLYKAFSNYKPVTTNQE